MKKTTVITLLLSIIALSTALQLHKDFTFDHYIEKFKKQYIDSAEREIREKIFNENVDKINKINSNPNKTARAGVNHLTDRTPEELKALRGFNSDMIKTKAITFLEIPDINVNDLPTEVDWRQKNVLNPIRDQGHCGSCWAFSTIANVEAHLAINTGKLLNLSEQQLVSCTPNPRHCGGKGGCNGAIEQLGFEYIAEHGITTRDNYPYQGKDSTCDQSLVAKKVAKVKGFVQLPKNSNAALLHAVATYGPVSVGVDASNFYLYDEGVWSDCGTTVNHAVVVVGYGVDKVHGPYWLVRNSWGTGFGESGHIRIARQLDDKDVKCAVDEHPEDGSACEGDTEKSIVCGTCGILFENTYADGAQLVDLE